MKYLMLVLLLGCGKAIQPVSLDAEYDLPCTDVGENMHRCENFEVICYGQYNVGIQCKFKGRK